MVKKSIHFLYHPETVFPVTSNFYSHLIGEIKADNIAPQVYGLLKAQERLEKMPMFFQVQLKQKQQQVVIQNFLIKKQTEQILRRLDAVNLSAIPLKGVYFAEKYFGSLGARSTSDIDLLVKENELDMVIHTIYQLGFITEEQPIPGHFHCSFSKEIPGSPVPLTVEIHWNLLRESTSNLKMDHFWNEAVPIEGYRYIKLLSDYHTFYAICLHGWRHNLDSPRHYLDIIQLIMILEDKVDYKRLFKDAKADQTLKRMKRTLSIVYQKYPWLNKIKTLPQNLTSRQKEKQQSGRYSRFFDYQFFSYDSVLHTLIEVYHWLFPNQYELDAELGMAHKSYINGLIRLYKKRSNNALKAMLPE